MQPHDFETVILGSGFAGLSVAHALQGGDAVVLDRGETLDLARASQHVDAGLPLLKGHPRASQFSAMVDLENRALRSQLHGNALSLPLSRLSSNVMSYVQGGISNWWGGYAARLTEATFERDGVLQWPLDLHTLVPYYEQAEQLMRVHGDPTAPDYRAFAALPGWDYWKGYFASTFPQARVTPQAKNISDHDAGPRGLCQGNGHCAVCPNDAKARPANVFPTIEVVGHTRVDEVVFQGRRAVAIRGVADGEAFELSFKRLVIAAGGLENVALLRRSNLPEVTKELLGQTYQDHTSCEVLGVLPEKFMRYALGSEGGIEIPELSGYFGNIEVKTVMLPTALTNEHAQCLASGLGTPLGVLSQFDALLERTACFYLQMEIPPEWNLQLRTRGHAGYIHAMPYLDHLPELDQAVLAVTRRMTDLGVRVAGAIPHHRDGFGGHHYSGTTPMSRHGRCVVDDNLQLLGSDNVYLNGGSVIPRCGGSGPTLTIAALGLRLGEHLRQG